MAEETGAQRSQRNSSEQKKSSWEMCLASLGWLGEASGWGLGGPDSRTRRPRECEAEAGMASPVIANTQLSTYCVPGFGSTDENW